MRVPILEDCIPIRRVTKLIPSHVPGKRGVHISTIYRWILRGIDGVKLQTVVIGGRRYTTHEMLTDFLSAVTAVRNGNETRSLPRCGTGKSVEAEAESLGI